MSSLSVKKIGVKDANDLATGHIIRKKGRELSNDDWEYLFRTHMSRYLEGHPRSKELYESDSDEIDWESNYKRMAIYEHQIMDAVCLVIDGPRRTDTLEQFKKQHAISSITNWNRLLQLDEKVLYEFREYLNWTEVSTRQFSDEFISYVAKFIDWRILSRGFVSESTIIKYASKLDWNALSKKGLPIAILRKFPSKVKWELLPPLHYDEDFMVEFYDRAKSSTYAPESKEFFKKVGWKNVNWKTIRVDHLETGFILKKIKKINWVLNREELSKREWYHEFIDEYCDRFIWKTLPVSHCAKEKYKKNDNFAKFVNRYKDQIDWDSLSRVLKSEKFIAVFNKYVNWDNLPAKQFTDPFVIKYQKQLYWPNVDIDHLDENTLTKCSKYLIWDRVSRRDEISIEFLRRFKTRINWQIIAMRKDIQKKVRKEFMTEIRPHLKDVYQTAEAVEENFTGELDDPKNQKFMGNYR